MSGPSGLTGSVCHDTRFPASPGAGAQREEGFGTDLSDVSPNHLAQRNFLRLTRYLQARNGSF